MPSPSTLRERVAIVANTPTRDEYGDESDVWATVETVYASVRPLSGSEFWAAQQVQSEVSHVFQMRYTANAVPDNRLSWDGRTFEILAVLDMEQAYLGVERKTWVDVHTREMVT